MAEQSNYSGSFPIAVIPHGEKYEAFDDNIYQSVVQPECELSHQSGHRGFKPNRQVIRQCIDSSDLIMCIWFDFGHLALLDKDFYLLNASFVQIYLYLHNYLSTQ